MFGALIGAVPVVAILLLIGLVKRRSAGRHGPVTENPVAPPPADATIGELSTLSQHLMEAHERQSAAVAKKLYDDVGQRIMGMTLRLRGLGAAPHDTAKQAVVDEIGDQLATVVGELATVPDPVYQKLELLGLTAASRAFCERLSAEHRVPVPFQHENVPADLPADVSLTLFRVLQDATAIAVVHSSPREISVSLRGTPSEIRLRIVHSGTGFETHGGAPGLCVGLVAIRERLKLVNGGSAIESRPGEGTRVEVWVPLPRRAATN